MTTLQEYLNNKYPTQEAKEQVKKISISGINKERRAQGITEILEGGELDLSEYVNVEQVNACGNYLKSKITKLTLGKLPKLTKLNCSINRLTSLDVSGCSGLTRLDCHWNQLTSLDFSGCDRLIEYDYIFNQLTSLKISPDYKDRTWKEIRDNTKPKIPGLEKLVDNSDLDNWVANYDESKIGDIEYHKFLGNKAGIMSEMNATKHWFIFLDYTSLDNLGNKVIARKYIILSRLLAEKEDLLAGKNQLYEEKMNELAEGCQMCGSMQLPGRTPDNPWTEQEQQTAVNKALNGDIELLSRLQDLPYLKAEFQFPSTKTFWQKIQALKEEVETHLEALDTAQEWRERQIQELTEQKDKEIEELKKQLEQTKINQTTKIEIIPKRN